MSSPDDEPVPAEGPAEAAPEPRPGIRRVLVRFVVVSGLVVADLWSKSAVFGWLGQRPEGMLRDSHGHLRQELVGEWLAFMLSYNPGMAWGFDGLPPWLLVGGRGVAVVFLGWLIARASPARPVLSLSLLLILAGAIGNLHDNLFLEPRAEGARFGEVRDFIDVYFSVWDWHFPTFNVADSCITVGAVLLFLSSFAPAPSPDPPPDPAGNRPARS